MARRRLKPKTRSGNDRSLSLALLAMLCGTTLALLLGLSRHTAYTVRDEAAATHAWDGRAKQLVLACLL